MTVEGVIDWGTAKPTDRDWQLKFLLIVRAFKRSLALKQLERRFQISVAALGTDNAKWFNDQHKEATSQELRIDQFVRPWHYAEHELIAAQQPTHDQLMARYRQVWGDPADPGFKQRLEQTLADIRAGKSK